MEPIIHTSFNDQRFVRTRLAGDELILVLEASCPARTPIGLVARPLPDGHGVRVESASSDDPRRPLGPPIVLTRLSQPLLAELWRMLAVLLPGRYPAEAVAKAVPFALGALEVTNRVGEGRLAVEAARPAFERLHAFISGLEAMRAPWLAVAVDHALRESDGALACGNFDQAVSILEPLMAHPEVSDRHRRLVRMRQARRAYVKGLKAERDGRLDEAAAAYQEAEAGCPDLEGVKHRLGMVALKTGRWDAAIASTHGRTGDEAAYLRGHAHLGAGEWRKAMREWQSIDHPGVKAQLVALNRDVAARAIVQHAEAGRVEDAIGASRYFLNQFGEHEAVRSSLDSHLAPRLIHEQWTRGDWEHAYDIALEAWLDAPGQTTLHNLAVAAFYRALQNPNHLPDAIAYLPAALLNLPDDPVMQDVPWLLGADPDLESLAETLMAQLSAAVESQRTDWPHTWRTLRDQLRVEQVAFAQTAAVRDVGPIGADLWLSPGLYNRHDELLEADFQEWFNCLDDMPNRLVHALYTPWGPSVAACLDNDWEGAVGLLPEDDPIEDSEVFALAYVRVNQAKVALRQGRWTDARDALAASPTDVTDYDEWTVDLDNLAAEAATLPPSVQEELDFAEWWFDTLDTDAARARVAELKAQRVANLRARRVFSREEALEALYELQEFCEDHPLVEALIAELDSEDD